MNVTHPQMVAALAKDGAAIQETLTPEKCHLLHMSTGVATEAGEIGDVFKRHVFYNQPLDRDNLLEELGDMEFYLEGIRNKTGITREEVLANNIKKLSVRYEKLAYSDAAAKERKDKQ